MSLAKKRLANELLSTIGIINPNADMDLLEKRMEEVLTNYDLTRFSEEEMQEDMSEKINMYLSAMKLEGLAFGTIYGYRLELEKFSAACNKATALVTTSDIRNFLSGFDNVMASTLAKKLITIKGFFGWLVREELLLRDPSAKIKTPKLPKRLKNSLTIEELELVRETCVSLRERAMIEMMYSTGCRLSEIANMKRSDINEQNLSIDVIGKGNKERTVYISYKAMFHLKKYFMFRRDKCDFLFVTQRQPFRQMSNAAISKEINNIEQRSGLRKPLTPHIFRHSFAQLATDAGIELSDLQQLMGHSDPSSTLIYSQVSEERKKQAYRKYHAQ